MALGEHSPARCLARTQDTELCILCADSREALRARIARLREFLGWRPAEALLDVAYTLAQSWRPDAVVLAVVASTTEDLDAKLGIAQDRLADPARRRIRHRQGIFYCEGGERIQGRLAYLFPGEGSQYVNMMRELCIRFPEVRHGFDLVDRACGMGEGGFVPSQLIFPPPGAPPSVPAEDGLWGMVAAVESVSAAGAAFRLLFEQLAIVPDAVVGHSSGEFMALETAGVLRLAGDEERTAFIHEGYVRLNQMLAREVTTEGILLAAGGIDRPVIDELLARFPDRVLVAIDNCPHQYVVCARPDVAEAAQQFLASKRAIVEALPFRRPYHTHWFHDTLDSLRQLFSRHPLHPPQIDIYSCATAQRFPADLATVTDWCVTQWARPVEFRRTIEQMYADGVRVFLEVGPRGNLTSFVHDILAGSPHVAVAPDRASRPGLAPFHEALAELAAHGVSMTLDPLFRRRAPRLLDLDATEAPAPPDHRMRLQLSPALLPEMSAQALLPRRPRPSAPTPADPPTHAEDPVVQAYFDTMESFLASQRQVMDQFIQHAAAPARPNGHETPATHTPDHDFPMLGRIESLVPGQSLAAVQDFNLEDYPFLGQHAFPGTAVSFEDPSLLGLPIMPLTFSLEMLAEAASMLAPGRVVVGMKDIRATRWVSFVEAHRSLRVTARVLETGAEWEVRAELRDAEGGKGRFRIQPTLVEATVLLAAAYGEQTDREPHRLLDEKPCQWTSETIYPENLFHGPMLQGILAMSRWGRDGMEGSIRVMSRDSLFRSTPTPRLAIDPVLLDSLGAMLYIWLDCEGPWKQRGVVLPFRAVEFRFHTPLLAPGTRLRVTLRVVSQSEMSAAADIRAIDADGRVVMDTRSWEGRTFDLGPALHGVFHTPTRHFLSTPLPASQALEMVGGAGTVLHLLDSLSLEFMRSSHGVWQTTIAFSIFDRNTRALWLAGSEPEDDRIRSLLSQAAAKDAARNYLKSQYQLHVASPDIHLSGTEDGALHCAGGWQAQGVSPPTIAVAAADHVAAAAALPAAGGARALSVDAGLRPPEELQAELRDDERQRFASRFSSDPRCPQQLWCAKQAAARAQGGTPDAWRVTAADDDVVRLVSADGAATAIAATVYKGPVMAALARIED